MSQDYNIIPYKRVRNIQERGPQIFYIIFRESEKVKYIICIHVLVNSNKAVATQNLSIKRWPSTNLCVSSGSIYGLNSVVDFLKYYPFTLSDLITTVKYLCKHIFYLVNIVVE